MKKILILVGKIGDRDSNVTDYLKKNLGGNVEVRLGLFESINFEISQGEVFCRLDNINLSDFNLVYMKVNRENIQLAGAIASYLNFKGIKFIDKNFSNLGPAGNKLGNLVKLALFGIPLPETLYFSKSKVLVNKEDIARKLGFPIFTKSLTKQKRAGLFIISEDSDFERLIREKESKGYLFQKRIEIEKEYRLVVMGGNVIGVHEEGVRKIGNNRVLVDSSESGSGWVDPKSLQTEIIKIVEKGTEAFNLNISGADACIEKGTGKIFVFEINRGPGLTLDPSISPELPELAKYLTRLL